MRNVPVDLMNHILESTNSIALLLKITLIDGTTSYGMTTLDRDVTYDGLTYSATNGFDPSVIATDLGYNVDNSEGYSLLSNNVPGITLEMALRGDLDGATWEMLLVNYENLLNGHVILDAGDLGDVKVVDDVVFIPELISYMMRLRATIGLVWSNTCRAIFGTPAVDGDHTGCGIDDTLMWTAGEVSAVDTTEPKRIFTGDAVNAPPARIKWTSGNNMSNRLYVVEKVDGFEITLFDSMPFDIEPTDTYDTRDDCDKTLDDCKVYDNVINMKAEPLRPIGDAVSAPKKATTPVRPNFVFVAN